MDALRERILRTLAREPQSDDDLEALFGDVGAIAVAVAHLVRDRYVGTTSMRVPGARLYRVHRITDAGRLLVGALGPDPS